MSTEQTLMNRSNSSCELCGLDNGLTVYEIPPNSDASAEQAILVCETCSEQINNPDKIDANHWRCLNESMWNQQPAVQVMAWRLLTQLNTEACAQDLLEMLYLEDDVKQWAQAMDSSDDDSNIIHKDSNGAILLGGDSVTLIKDLDVKGANFTAKRGTMVKNISLTDNPEQIEGRVNGTRIVLLTKFLPI